MFFSCWPLSLFLLSLGRWQRFPHKHKIPFLCHHWRHCISRSWYFIVSTHFSQSKVKMLLWKDETLTSGLPKVKYSRFLSWNKLNASTVICTNQSVFSSFLGHVEILEMVKCECTYMGLSKTFTGPQSALQWLLNHPFTHTHSLSPLFHAKLFLDGYLSKFQEV